MPIPFVIKEEVDEENKILINLSTVVIPEVFKSSSSSSGTPIGIVCAEVPNSGQIFDKPFEMLRKISYESTPSPSTSQTARDSSLTIQGTQ
jgi:hypothetical protein